MQSSYGEELGVGEKIAGRYEVLSVLGKGSFGVVYKARHDILGRIVAIKTLRLQRIVDDRSAKRFEREAKVACMVEHPNIIKVFDFGYTGDGVPYLVMDYVSGIPLYNILKEERNITVDRAVVLFSQVCDGLYHAHQRGVIHRDLKPANIMVVKKEHEPESVRIVDLGVAKIVAGEEEAQEAITRTGEVCGSPIYLSPEQCVYQELDPRTDIYSLGVCLYESLTGVPPLRGATVYDTIYMHVNEKPKSFKTVAPYLDIPPRVEEIVMRCLAKRPGDRFETMQELKQELMAALRGGSAPAINVLSPDQLFQRPKKDGAKSTGQHTPVESLPAMEVPRAGESQKLRQQPDTGEAGRLDGEGSAAKSSREMDRVRSTGESGKHPARDKSTSESGKHSTRDKSTSESGRLPQIQAKSGKQTKQGQSLTDTITHRIRQTDPIWRIVGVAGLLFGIGALIYAFYVTQTVESRYREQALHRNDPPPVAASDTSDVTAPQPVAPPVAKTAKPGGVKPKKGTKPKDEEPKKRTEESVKTAKHPNKDEAKKAAAKKKGLQDGTQDMALSGMEMVKSEGKKPQKKDDQKDGEHAPGPLSIFPDLFGGPKKEKEKEAKKTPPETKIAASTPGKKAPAKVGGFQPMEAKLDPRDAEPPGGEAAQPGPAPTPPQPGPPQPQLTQASRDVELAETFYRTGRQEFNNGNFSASIKAFESAYSRYPNENYKRALAAALNEGALTYSRNHQYSIAVSYQSRACDLFPNNEKYQKNLAGYKANLQTSGSY